MRNEIEFFNRLDRVFSAIETIGQFVRKAVGDAQCPREEKLLYKNEVADILGVCERTVDRWREQKILEYILIGGQVRFEKEAIWRCIRSKIKKTSPITRDDFERNYQLYVTDKRKTVWRK